VHKVGNKIELIYEFVSAPNCKCGARTINWGERLASSPGHFISRAKARDAQLRGSVSLKALVDTTKKRIFLSHTNKPNFESPDFQRVTGTLHCLSYVLRKLYVICSKWLLRWTA